MLFCIFALNRWFSAKAISFLCLMSSFSLRFFFFLLSLFSLHLVTRSLARSLALLREVVCEGHIKCIRMCVPHTLYRLKINKKCLYVFQVAFSSLIFISRKKNKNNIDRWSEHVICVIFHITENLSNMHLMWTITETLVFNSSLGFFSRVRPNDFLHFPSHNSIQLNDNDRKFVSIAIIAANNL